MDIFLFGGVILGGFAIVFGMYLKGADVGTLLNPAAMMIIGVGSIAALLNSFPKNEFKKITKLFGVLFKQSKFQEPTKIIEQMVELAQTARKDGLLALEGQIENFDNELMKNGFRMVIDGSSQEHIRELLDLDIESMEERHRLGALIFTSAGGTAPTLGVLGAVVGLIGALGNLNDVEALGHMIAAAFVATLYGIFFGYVIFHPFASRLKRKSAQELQINRIITEGILSIQAGENPNNIKMKLIALLEPAQKKHFEEGKEPSDV